MGPDGQAPKFSFAGGAGEQRLANTSIGSRQTIIGASYVRFLDSGLVDGEPPFRSIDIIEFLVETAERYWVSPPDDGDGDGMG